RVTTLLSRRRGGEVATGGRGRKDGSEGGERSGGRTARAGRGGRARAGGGGRARAGGGGRAKAGGGGRGRAGGGGRAAAERRGEGDLCSHFKTFERGETGGARSSTKKFRHFLAVSAQKPRGLHIKSHVKPRRNSKFFCREGFARLKWRDKFSGCGG